MLRKNQQRGCFLLMCILLITGIYTTYVKADYIAECAVGMQSAWAYAEDEAVAQLVKIQKPDNLVLQNAVCVVERINPGSRTLLGRAAPRRISLRRDLRLFSIFLCAICAAHFILRYWQAEETFCLHEKKYRAALIKYIHDMDGKKRVSCLIK